MLTGFKKFLLRGNVIDMATGIIIGSAFTAIVKSLVEGVFTPPLGLLVSGIDFRDWFLVLKRGHLPPPYDSLEVASECGAVTINYGLFLNSVISFVIVATVIYFMINYVMRLHKEEKKKRKESPEEKLLTEIRDLLKASAK